MKNKLKDQWAALLFIIIVGLSFNALALSYYLKVKYKEKEYHNTLLKNISDSNFKEGDRIKLYDTNIHGVIGDISDPIYIEYAKIQNQVGLLVLPVIWNNTNCNSFVYELSLRKTK